MSKIQRQQPFYVRRARMKDYIVKSSQVLQDLQYALEKGERKRLVTQPINIASSQFRKKKTHRQVSVSQAELLNSRLCHVPFSHIRFAQDLLKANRQQNASSQMESNGLQAIKIQSRPIVPFIFRNKNVLKLPYDVGANKKGHIDASQKFRKNKSTLRYFVEHRYEESRNSNRSKTSEILQSQLIIQKKNTEKTFSKSKKKLLFNIQNQRQRDKNNLVYQRRIKSYTDFLWKLFLAHRIYTPIDLVTKWNQKKFKAFVGGGNNSNMIKGLIKRRFWWAISEQFSQDSLFIWTQIKNNKIFQRQQSCSINDSEIKFTHQQSNMTKNSSYESKKLKKRLIVKISDQLKYDKKILRQDDHRILVLHSYQNMCNSKNVEKKSNQQIFYASQKQKIIKKYKKLAKVSTDNKINENSDKFYQVLPIVHNHLPNNFLLGNKKALFFNLKKYYQSQSKNIFQTVPLTFHIKNGFSDPSYKSFVKYFRLIQKNNKDGLQRQSRNMWIVKPGQNSNRGQNIIVIDQIYQLDNIIKKAASRSKIVKKPSINQHTFIVQKYIENPLLYNNRKFDIRHYFIMTNLFGVVRAYWYEEGYIRTSSYMFNSNNFQPQIHLTNDAIQQNYSQYGRYQPFNKLSYSQFQTYLNTLPQKHNFKQQILPQMKKIVLDCAKSVYQNISPKNQMHNFQIFGMDFMLDSKFKPWLIQINTNPCLDCTSPLLNRIIPYMVQHVLKLTLDVIYPPPSHYPILVRHNAPLVDLETFKFSLIFDSLGEKQQHKREYSEINPQISQLGALQDDDFYRDDGHQIKLEDFS